MPLTNGLCAIIACYIGSGTERITNVDAQLSDAWQWFRTLAGDVSIEYTVTTSEGDIYTYKDGLLHSIKDRPAVRITFDSCVQIQLWYRNGLKHRDLKPAVIDNLGMEEWWQDGRLHRIGAPAVIEPLVHGGYQEWWLNGALHRDDGPAHIRKNGHCSWWSKGRLVCHRPAIITQHGEKIWVDKNGLKIYSESANGEKNWYNNG